MYRCEQKKLFKVTNVKQWRWVEREAEGLMSGSDDHLRCMHCHGVLRVYVRKVPGGSADHVGHVLRADSENCRGGAYFKGEHRMSQSPIE